MAGRTLADAVIAVRPDFSKATAGADAAGRRAGQSYSDGFTRDADGKLKKAHGKFGEDARKISSEAGGRAGTGFGTQFGDKFTTKTKSALGGWAKEAGRFLIPVGIVGAIAEIGKIGTAYEDNLNIFQSVTRATGAQMDLVAAKARQLGADTKLPGVSAAGAAEAMTELAKSGLSVAQAMEAARGTLQLARAASISEAQAAEITGNAINAFGLKAKDTTFVVDELAAAANSSSVEVGDVSDAFKMAAAVFAGFQRPTVGAKESITELNTAIAILGNNGIKGSDAGTSLKQMLLQLTGPTEHAKHMMQDLAYAAGGANIPVKLQADIMHGTAKEYRKGSMELERLNPQLKGAGDIAFDAAGKMRPLSQIIDLVTRGTKGMTDEEKDFTITQIFGADASRSVIALMKGGLPTYEAQRKAVLQVGAASDVAAAKNKGLKGAIDNVRSQVENAAIAIYNAVKGPLTKSLNGLAEELPGVFDKVGALFSFLGQHKAVVKDLATAIIALTVANKIWAASVAIEAAGGLAAWALQTRLGVAATKAWTVVTWLATAGQRASMSTIGTWIGVKGLEAGAWVRSTIATGTNTVANVANRAAVATRNAVTAAFVAVKNLEIGAWIRATATTVANTAALIASRVAAFAVRGATIAWAGAQWLLNAALNANPIGLVVVALGALAAGLIYAYKHSETFRKIVDGLFHWFTGTFVPGLRDGINNLVVAAKFIWKVMQAAWIGIRTVIQVEVNIVFGIFRLVKWWFTTALPAAGRALAAVIGIVFRTIWQGVKAVWDSIRTGSFEPLRNFITKTLPDAFRSGVSAIKRAWDTVRAAALTPVAFVVKSVINPLINGWDAISKIFGGPHVDTIKGFSDGGDTGVIPGAPSRRDNRIAAFIAGGKLAGTLAVASGEYVVNTESSQANLGLIDTVNKKRGRVALRDVLPHLGGYDSGGLIGWAKTLVGKGAKAVSNVFNVVTNPSKALADLANSAIRAIPGAGGIRDLLVSAGRKLVANVVAKIKSLFSFSGGAGGIGGNASPGFPPWPSSPSASRGDSGVWRNVVALIKSTGPVSGSFGNAYRPGDPLWHGSGRAVDWMGYNQDALATFLASRRPLELIHRSSRRDYAYTRGVNKGSFNEILMNQHKNHVHIAMALGGLLTDRGKAWSPGKGYAVGGLAKIATADTGHVTLERGWNLIGNNTGAREPLALRGSGGGDIHFHFHGPVASKQAAKDMVLDAYKSLVQSRRITPGAVR